MRTGPLSPAMLSGPANDYFSDTHHLRGGFPTPNESSLRSGLTPGGSGSMFPATSPNSQAIFAQLGSGGATPSTIDFHRTAISAAAKREHVNATQQQPSQQSQQQRQQASASQSQGMAKDNGASAVKSESKPASGPFDPHDNDAANGLFMLAQGAQGRSGSQSSSQFPAATAQSHAHPAPTSPQNAAASPRTANTHATSMESGRGVSEGSRQSDDGEPAKPNPRSKGKKNTSTNGRRKADDAPGKGPPHKRARSSDGLANGSTDASEEEVSALQEEGGSKSKMTDDEKRKNFLERNR